MVEEALAENERPSGLDLTQVSEPSEVESQTHPADYCPRKAWLNFLNFADGTYILARHVRMLEHHRTAQQEAMCRAGQILNVEKCEVVCPPGTQSEEMPSARISTRRKLHDFVLPGQWPYGEELMREQGRETDNRRVRPVSQMLVLGSFITIHRPAAAALRAFEACLAQRVPIAYTVAESSGVNARASEASGWVISPTNRAREDQRFTTG